GEECVWVYAALWAIDKALTDGRIAREVAARAFEAALDQPWSVLGMHSQVNYRWLEDPARADRFLAAMVRHWDALDAVGARYTMGPRRGQRLWDVPLLLKFVLMRQGVPQDDLLQPLPPGGLTAFVRARARH